MTDEAHRFQELGKRLSIMAADAYHAAREQVDHYEVFKFYGRAAGLQEAAMLAYGLASEALEREEVKLDAKEAAARAQPAAIKPRGLWARILGLD